MNTTRQVVYDENSEPITIDVPVLDTGVSSDDKVVVNSKISAGAKTDVFSTQTGDATPAGVSFGRTLAVFEASFTSTDAASCTIKLYGTNEAGDITNGALLATFSLSTAAAGTTKLFEPVTRPYLEVYAKITDSLGTLTAIDLNWVG